MLGLTRTITSSFSTLDSLLILYVAVIRPKLENSSTVWNSITTHDAIKPERMQRKITGLRQYRSFIYDQVTYEDFRKFLNLQTGHNRIIFLFT